MKLLTVLLWVFVAVYFVTYLYLLIISRKPFKLLFLNAICGWWLFIVVELFSFISGLHIPLNTSTALLSAFSGAPGTILLIVLRYCIFI